MQAMIESVHEEIDSAKERGEISQETAAEAARTIGMIAAEEDDPDPRTLGRARRKADRVSAEVSIFRGCS